VPSLPTYLSLDPPIPAIHQLSHNFDSQMSQSRRRSYWCQGLCPDVNSYLVGVVGLSRHYHFAVSDLARLKGHFLEEGHSRLLERFVSFGHVFYHLASGKLFQGFGMGFAFLLPLLIIRASISISPEDTLSKLVGLVSVFSIVQPQSADWLDGWVVAPPVAGLGWRGLLVQLLGYWSA